MRIVIFSPALAVTSGSGIRARLIAEGLKKCDLDVFVVSTWAPEKWNALGIQLYPLEDDKSWAENLLAATEKLKPDVILGITEAGADALYEVRKKTNCVAVLDIHGLGFVEVIELGAGFGPRLRRIWNSFNWLSRVPFLDAVTIANPTLYPIIRPFNRNAFPLFGMTDIAHFNGQGNRVSLGNDRSRLQILYAGNYYKWQGVRILFDAIKNLRKESDCFEFNFLGSVGKDTDTIQQLELESKLCPLNFIDKIEFDEIPDYYRSADVLVIPRPLMMSTYLAFPQKLVDYMASGRAIVATNLAPHRWALGNPKAGLLCPPNSEGLTDAFRRMTDQHLREKIGQVARQRAMDSFCHLKQSRRMYALFERILDKRNR